MAWSGTTSLSHGSTIFAMPKSQTSFFVKITILMAFDAFASAKFKVARPWCQRRYLERPRECSLVSSPWASDFLQNHWSEAHLQHFAEVFQKKNKRSLKKPWFPICKLTKFNKAMSVSPQQARNLCVRDHRPDAWHLCRACRQGPSAWSVRFT